MKTLFYFMSILLLLSCGQKGNLVRPKTTDALATPSTSQEITMLDATATPVTTENN
jgi:predicted small lipoprotein YifL